MELALHFHGLHGLHPDLGDAYGRAAWRLVYPGLLDQRGTHVVSTVFVGDLLFGNIDTSRDGRHRSSSRPDLKYSDVLEFWLRPQNPVWARLCEERPTPALGQIYAIFLESVDQAAERLHQGLLDAASYLGAMEVDDGSFIHWQLYSKNLIPLFRVVGHGAQVYWDGLSDRQNYWSPWPHAAGPSQRQPAPTGSTGSTPVPNR